MSLGVDCQLMRGRGAPHAAVAQAQIVDMFCRQLPVECSPRLQWQLLRYLRKIADPSAAPALQAFAVASDNPLLVGAAIVALAASPGLPSGQALWGLQVYFSREQHPARYAVAQALQQWRLVRPRCQDVTHD